MRLILTITLVGILFALTSCENASIVDEPQNETVTNECVHYTNEIQDKIVLDFIRVRMSEHLPIYADNEFRMIFQGRFLNLEEMQQEVGYPFINTRATFEDANFNVIYRLVYSLTPYYGNDTPWHMAMWEDPRPRLQITSDERIINIRFMESPQLGGYFVAVVNIDDEVRYYSFCYYALIEAEIITRPTMIRIPMVLPDPFHPIRTNAHIRITAPNNSYPLTWEQMSSSDWLVIYRFGQSVFLHYWEIGIDDEIPWERNPAHYRLRTNWEQYVQFEMAFYEPSASEPAVLFSFFPCYCCGKSLLYVHGENVAGPTQLFFVDEAIFNELQELL